MAGRGYGMWKADSSMSAATGIEPPQMSVIRYRATRGQIVRFASWFANREGTCRDIRMVQASTSVSSRNYQTR